MASVDNRARSALRPTITGITSAEPRAGSVLILVVALLVLLALIGIAWLSTSRLDLQAASQHTRNTQAEILLDSVQRLAVESLVSDLEGQSGSTGRAVLRPPTSEPSIASVHRTVDSSKTDPYLASRTPIADGNGPLGPVVAWPAVSAPLTAGVGVFESPVVQPGIASRLDHARFDLRPGAATITTPNGPAELPALRGTTNDGAPALILAADTDGDGIADAGWWKLPVGPINGITYYAASRIIDNAAAFNAAVHWKPIREFAQANAQPGKFNDNFFTTNIDFESALLPGPNHAREMNRLNAYRFNDPEFSFADMTRDYGDRAVASAMTVPVEDPPTPGDADSAQGPRRRLDMAWTSPFDEFYHQLAARLENPGVYDLSRTSAFQRFRALEASDSAALAAGFVVRRSKNDLSDLERLLPDSMGLEGVLSATTPATPYPSGNVAAWFRDNFNYADSQSRWSRRALTVTRNPVSNLAFAHELSAVPAGDKTADWTSDPLKMPDRAVGSISPRVSLNTATFGELWRGFWMAMDSPFLSSSPYPQFDPSRPGAAPYQMFRSPLRDPSNNSQLRLNADQVALLRSAAAAVNAIDLRDSDDDVTSASFTTQIAGEAVDVRVFGTERQPFITEVYVSNDNSKPDAFESGTKANPKGFIAVELYNPSSKPIRLNGWTLGLLARNAANAGQMSIYPIPGFGGFGPEDVVPATTPTSLGYLVLGNWPGPNGVAQSVEDASYVPKSASVEGFNRYRYVTNLHKVLHDEDDPATGDGFELVLLRPRSGKGIPANAVADPLPAHEVFNDKLQLSELAPVDSFDFGAGFGLVKQGSKTFTVYHYARLSGKTQQWKCVYPGRWSVGNGSPFRQEFAVRYATWTRGAGQNNSDPWRLGGSQPTFPPVALGGEDPVATYENPFPDIPLNDSDRADFNQVGSPDDGKQRFPFGGYATNGDLLRTPYIGSYVIRLHRPAGSATAPDDAPIIEMNPLTMDAAAADDLNPNTDTIEQVGRFCPLRYSDAPAAYSSPSPLPPDDPYGWASDIFEHFSVQNPHDDYLPNVEPKAYAAAYTAATGQAAQPPAPVRNSPGVSANDDAEALVPLQGLINVNTAPLPVLAAVPYTADRAVNRQIAQMIVRFRDGDRSLNVAGAGYFKSIFDLNQVVSFDAAGRPDLARTFQNGLGTATDTDSRPSDIETGDADEDAPPPPPAKRDFRNQFRVLNRISNLLTVRSDSYTCYLQLQGWRNAGTENARLIVERRRAFIADRAQATSSNRTVLTLPVDSN